jgi:hypothetical protein
MGAFTVSYRRIDLFREWSGDRFPEEQRAYCGADRRVIGNNCIVAMKLTALKVFTIVC